MMFCVTSDILSRCLVLGVLYHLSIHLALPMAGWGLYRLPTSRSTPEMGSYHTSLPARRIGPNRTFPSFAEDAHGHEGFLR